MQLAEDLLVCTEPGVLSSRWLLKIPEFERWRQEDEKLKVIFGSIVGLKPAWDTYHFV